MIRSEHNYLVPTMKETPHDAEVVSHQLMMRSGMVRKLSAGLYTFLPLGLKVLRKVEAIIREEMNRYGAQELLMPVLQPAELWKKSGRWATMGPEMLRLKNRQERDFVLGPTHEEVITDLVSRELHSYKNLPSNFYQIQTKIRDEVRPRFGVMRAKEFIMKDAYSFHDNEKSLDRMYQHMAEAYHAIFARCGLKVVAVEADSGTMGGSGSAEFMVLADSGEDQVVFCDVCDYGANVETGLSAVADIQASPNIEPYQEVATFSVKTIEEVADFLQVAPNRLIKTLFYKADEELVCVLVRGSDQINEIKLKNHLGVEQLELANQTEVEGHVSTYIGFAGPIGLTDIRIIADPRVVQIEDGVTGANAVNKHIQHVSYVRGDYQINETVDLVVVQAGETCSRCEQGALSIKNGIEVGHIFKLGQKYSKALNAKYLDQNGKEQIMIMGCYGIGVSRTVAAVIEQSHDENGIVWPVAVAPFEVCIVPVKVDDQVAIKVAKDLYADLHQLGYDVLLDDRSERAGFKFKDADLIGFPVRVVVSEKLLADNCVEIKVRRTGEILKVPQGEAKQKIDELIKNLQKKEMRGHGK